MWELEHKESWAPKNWCFWTVVLEKTFESPLDCKIKPVNPKGNQSWIFTGKTDAEAEAPILWSPDAKNRLIGKTLMLRKIEGRRRGQQRMRCLDGINWLDGMSLSRLWVLVMDRGAWHAAVHRVAKSRTWLNDWITIPLSKGLHRVLPTNTRSHTTSPWTLRCSPTPLYRKGSMVVFIETQDPP